MFAGSSISTDTAQMFTATERMVWWIYIAGTFVAIAKHTARDDVEPSV